jgi:hypothetical protein
MNIETILLYWNNPSIYKELEICDYIICIQTLALDINKINNPFQRIIILNTEQYTRKKWFYYHILFHLKNGFRVLDYQRGNILFMNQQTHYKFQKQFLYLPPLYNPEDEEYLCNKKSKNVCFLGGGSEYRNKILSTLKSIDYIQDFGTVRDKKLSQYKVLLNIHADPSNQILETIRCYRYIFHGILVVSQQTSYKDDPEIDELIYFCDDDEIQKKIEDILINYSSIKFKSKEFFIEWSKKKVQEFIDLLTK